MSRLPTRAFPQPDPSLTVRVFNGVGRLLRRCGWRRPLCAERILTAARRRTGLGDFGDPDVREPVGRLVGELERENRLTPLGRRLIHNAFVWLAEARLCVRACLREHPAVLDEPVSRPVFVLGLPRTGSTLLHRLLAQDPAARTLYLWELGRPGPPVPDALRARHIRHSRRSLAFFIRHLAPRMPSIHPLDADAPEECRLLLMNTFRSPALSQYGSVPGYLNWLDGLGDENTLHVYEEYRRQLQLLQWRRPPRRWVLKCPLHASALEILLRLFPDACVVQTHRDLADVIPSLCSLHTIGRGVYSDDVDPCRIAAECVEHAGRILGPALRARAVHPGRVFDVTYRSLVRDPVGTVRGIYERFGLAMTAGVEKGMRAWLSANPQGKHGRHRYSLEQFGLDRDAIDRLFPGYPECFGISAADPIRC